MREVDRNAECGAGGNLVEGELLVEGDRMRRLPFDPEPLGKGGIPLRTAR